MSWNLNQPATSSSLDSLPVRENFYFLKETIDTHVSGSNAHNADAIDIDVIGSPLIDNVEEFHSNILSAGTFCVDLITDGGDGTITVSSGSGLIRASDLDSAPLLSFEWASSSSIAVGDDVLTYVYLDYNGGSPLIRTTTDRNDISDNCEVCIGHVYKESGSITIHTRTGGLNTCDITRRTDRRIKDLRNFERSSGMVTSETGTRNIAITAGEGWRGLDKFDTLAKNTSGSADDFIYWYRDGAGGWTKVSGSTQINNTQYDDGSGALQTVGVGRYGVHWVFLCHDPESHIDIVYGQGNYKLAEAQAAEVPSGLPDKVDYFDLIIAKIIILRDAATFTEVSTAFEIYFPRSEVINHNDLGNIDGGQANEYYHLENAEHGALVDGGSADGYHTHPDSGSADTLDSVCERGATTDVAITVTSSGSVLKALNVVNNEQIGGNLRIEDFLVIGDPFYNAGNPNNRHNYLLVGNASNPNDDPWRFENRFCVSSAETSPTTCVLAGTFYNIIMGTPDPGLDSAWTMLGLWVGQQGIHLSGSMSVGFAGIESTVQFGETVGLVTMPHRSAGVIANYKITSGSYDITTAIGVWGQAIQVSASASATIEHACSGYFEKNTKGVNNYSVYAQGLIYSVENVEAGGDIKADGDIYINDDETAANPTIHFKYNGGIDKTLRWDNTYSSFILGDRLIIWPAAGNPILYLGWGNYIQFNATTDGFEFNNSLGIGSAQTNTRLTIAGTQGSVDNAFGVYMGALVLTPADGWSAYFQYVGGGTIDASGSTIAKAIGLHGAAINKSAGTIITDTYGLYVNPSTVGVNNYGAYIGGKVGIGVTTPTRELEVSGDIYVDGTITAETSGSVLKSLRVQNDLQVGGDLEVDDNVVVDGTITVLSSGSVVNSLKVDNNLHVYGDLDVEGVFAAVHNNLSGLQGGKANEYYHLENAEHGALVDGGSADGYHTHPASGSGGGAGTGTIILPVQSAKISGGYITLPARIDAGNAAWRLLFAYTQTESAVWQFRMPQDYSSGLVTKLIYTMAASTSGSIDMEVEIMALSDGEADPDVASFDAVNEVDGGTTVPDTAGKIDEISITCSNDDGVAANDLVIIRINRDHDDVDDTATSDVELRAITFEYTTS